MKDNVPSLAIDPERVAQFCRQRGIRRLSLFGSAVRDDFDPARSDVDVLVEFLPGRTPGIAFIGYQYDLEEMLRHKVDLHTPDCLHRLFRNEVLREAVTVYEQT